MGDMIIPSPQDSPPDTVVAEAPNGKAQTLAGDKTLVDRHDSQSTNWLLNRPDPASRLHRVLGGRARGCSRLRRRCVLGWMICKMILLLILPNDLAPQSLIQTLRLGVVFLNRNEQGHLLQVSLVFELFYQCAPNALVLICGQELYACQRYARPLRTTRSRPIGQPWYSMTRNVQSGMAPRMVSRVQSSYPVRYSPTSASRGNLPCASVAVITTPARKATSSRVAGRSWIVIRLLVLEPPNGLRVSRRPCGTDRERSGTRSSKTSDLERTGRDGRLHARVGRALQRAWRANSGTVMVRS